MAEDPKQLSLIDLYKKQACFKKLNIRYLHTNASPFIHTGENLSLCKPSIELFLDLF